MAVAVKKHAKVDIKLFLSCPVLLNFSSLFQIFCIGLQAISFATLMKQNKLRIYKSYIYRRIASFLISERIGCGYFNLVFNFILLQFNLILALTRLCILRVVFFLRRDQCNHYPPLPPPPSLSLHTSRRGYLMSINVIKILSNPSKISTK